MKQKAGKRSRRHQGGWVAGSEAECRKCGGRIVNGQRRWQVRGKCYHGECVPEPK